MSDDKPKFQVLEYRDSENRKFDLDECQWILDKMQEEEAVAIAVTVVKTNGHIASSYHLGPNSFTLLGAVENLKQRLWDEEIKP